MDDANAIVYRRAYSLTCWKRDRFLGDRDIASLDPAEQRHRLVDLIAAELEAAPDAREWIQRGVGDAMAGRLLAW